MLGIALKDILKRDQWLGLLTWQRHYNKKIINSRESYVFKAIILKKASNLGSVDLWFSIWQKLGSIIQYYIDKILQRKTEELQKTAERLQCNSSFLK